MDSTKGQTSHKVLLVDDDDVVRGVMSESLESKGFEVVSVGGVTAALKCIATESFEVLIILEADEIVVKPVEVKQLAELVRERLLTQKPATQPSKERVSEILQRCSALVVKNWLERVKQARELNHLVLEDAERTGHLPKLIEDLVLRLRRPITDSPKDSDAICSPAAVLHGELRYLQGYTPEMLVHESRILQVTLFGTLKDNMNALDFSLLLTDVMTIADEVDAQLTQTMGSYMKLTKSPKATRSTAA
jgi:CheY-like chemotaxis protein